MRPSATFCFQCKIYVNTDFNSNGSSILREHPKICTYFYNLNNVQISWDPPIHPKIWTPLTKNIGTLVTEDMSSMLTFYKNIFTTLNALCLYHISWISIRKFPLVQMWKQLFSRCTYLFVLRNLNRQLAVTHPPTQIWTLFGFLKYIHIIGHSLIGP